MLREEETDIVKITDKLRFGSVSAEMADTTIRKFSRHHLLTTAQLIHVANALGVNIGTIGMDHQAFEQATELDRKIGHFFAQFGVEVEQTTMFV
jgi:hypothetical protein